MTGLQLAIGDPPSDLTSVGAFARRLRRLREAAGQPTFRQLHDQAELAGLQLPTSTAQELLSGRRRPRWGTVEAFVVASTAHAHSRRPPLVLPTTLEDLRSWRRWFEGLCDQPPPSDVNSRPPTGDEPGPQAISVQFAVAVDEAHNALRRLSRRRASLADLESAAVRAVHKSDLYAMRERMLTTGSPAVVVAGERLFAGLIGVRDAVRSGATLPSPEYHDAYHPFAEALWSFRMAVRVERGHATLSPDELGRTNWRDDERCPDCRRSIT